MAEFQLRQLQNKSKDPCIFTMIIFWHFLKIFWQLFPERESVSLFQAEKRRTE